MSFLKLLIFYMYCECCRGKYVFRDNDVIDSNYV